MTAHDAGVVDGIHFLVMEYVDGCDLHTLVKKRGSLSVPHAVDCVTQAASGLAHAHTRQIIHRDVKPSNLMLQKDGVVKILDFGLARFEDVHRTTGAGELTGSHEVMGTFDFMAPEQAIDAHGVDHRCDIYSLGCTLFFLLAGRPVYPSQTLMQALLAHRDEPIPSLRRGPPGDPATA